MVPCSYENCQVLQMKAYGTPLSIHPQKNLCLPLGHQVFVDYATSILWQREIVRCGNTQPPLTPGGTVTVECAVTLPRGPERYKSISFLFLSFFL